MDASASLLDGDAVVKEELYLRPEKDGKGVRAL